MKKTLLFAALAIGLASCANEADVFDPVTPEAISFKTVSQKQTRGAFEGAYLPVKTDIYVGAFVKLSDAYTPYLTDAVFSIYDDTALENDRRWTADYYWPATGDVDFLAYTCDYGTDQRKPAATWNSDATNKYITGLSLDFSSAALDGQTDVCYSEVVKAQRKASGGFDTPGLKFRHAQAWVMVNFSKGTSGYADDVIMIRYVKVNNVNLTGNLEISLADASALIPEIAWTPAGAASAVSFPAFDSAGDAGLNFGAASTADTKGILLLPCDEQSISFQYKMKNGVDASGNPTYTDWINYATDPASTTLADHKWEAGKKYTYSFGIVSNKIEFSTTVQGFDNTDVNTDID